MLAFCLPLKGKTSPQQLARTSLGAVIAASQECGVRRGRQQSQSTEILHLF